MIRSTEISRWVWQTSSSNEAPPTSTYGTHRDGYVPVRLDQETELEESIFAFSNAPDEQIGHVRKGGSTGAKVRLVAPVNGNKGYVVVSSGEKETIFDVAKNLGRDVLIENTPFTLRIENYWPDFRIEKGKPSSFGDEPNNPAVFVTLFGKGVPVSEAETNPHGGGKELTTTGGPPTMPAPGGGNAKSSHVVYRR